MATKQPKPTPVAAAVADTAAPQQAQPQPDQQGPGFSVIPDQLRQALLNYLTTRPWAESNDFIVGLANLPRFNPGEQKK